ncbi:MAG: multiheme c-type cytochrome [Nitrospirota bacterium]
MIKRKNILLFLTVLSFVLLAVGTSYAADYVGSEKCFKCHAAKYNDWKVSGHPYKIRKAEIAKFSPLPLPEGYSWDDISYVVGGYKWKARYMDKKGYIITSAGGKPGKNQYNMMVGKWGDYHPGEVKKYDCGRCHTTGYSKEGNQDGLEGIVGTWKAPGIQCEACHGPGSEHVVSADKTKIKVDKSAAFCGQCHIRGAKEKIPAKGGFIRHHEQYNELLASPHKGFDCVLCHDPHKKAEFSIRKDCALCHEKAGKDYAGSKMQKIGIKCTDCHMPKATKSAVAFGKYEADVKTHLFKINTDATTSMFTADGKFAKGFTTVEYSCLQCHKDRDKGWAAAKAKGVHSIGK